MSARCDMGLKAQQWLKLFHILFASLWITGALTISSKQFILSAQSDAELYSILSMMQYIDNFIIIPGAMGCLITGILYSSLTKWGWFKHRWVTIKWLICLYGVIFGTYPLGPWLNEMVEISRIMGLESFSHGHFMHNLMMLKIFGSFQAATIVFAFYVSVFKPWRKKAHS